MINCDEDFTEVCYQGSNQQYLSIGPVNGLADKDKSLNHRLIWMKLVLASLGPMPGLARLRSAKLP